MTIDPPYWWPHKYNQPLWNSHVDYSPSRCTTTTSPSTYPWTTSYERPKQVVASGYFNPLGAHHLDYLKAAAQLGLLTVIVNTDEQVRLKSSIPFQSEKERLAIVESIKEVSRAILSVDGDMSVSKTLVFLRSLNLCDVFVNGGDVEDCREAGMCRELGIEVLYGVGGRKLGSSSLLIERAAREWLRRQR